MRVGSISFEILKVPSNFNDYRVVLPLKMKFYIELLIGGESGYRLIDYHITKIANALWFRNSMEIIVYELYLLGDSLLHVLNYFDSSPRLYITFTSTFVNDFPPLSTITDVLTNLFL